MTGCTSPDRRSAWRTACPRAPCPRRAAAGDGAAHSPRLSWEHQSERVTPPAHIALRLGLPDTGQPVTRTRYVMSAGG